MLKTFLIIELGFAFAPKNLQPLYENSWV